MQVVVALRGNELVWAMLSGQPAEGPLWVAHVAIEGFEPQPGGALAVGSRHELTLEPVGAHHDLERTSFVDDTDSGREIWFATGIEPGR